MVHSRLRPFLPEEEEEGGIAAYLAATGQGRPPEPLPAEPISESILDIAPVSPEDEARRVESLDPSAEPLEFFDVPSPVEAVGEDMTLDEMLTGRAPMREPNDRFFMGTPNYSSEQFTPEELSEMDPGFQAKAMPDPRDPAPPPMTGQRNVAETRAARAEYAEANQPPAFADESAQKMFGKAYEGLTGRDQATARAYAEQAMGKQDSYERAISRQDLGTAPPLRLPRPDTFAKAGKVMKGEKEPEMTPYQQAQVKLAQGRLDLARQKAEGKDEPKALPRPGAGAAREQAKGELADRLRESARSALETDDLPVQLENEITAVTRLKPKDRAKAEIKFAETLRKMRLASVRGGVGASAEKRQGQVEDFNKVQKRYGLYIESPGMYTDMINARGSATRLKNVTSVNRSMHASARLLELDQLYRKIPVFQRGTEEALEIVSEYNYLKAEHQGIILQISGQGQGTEAARHEIKAELPNIGTTLAHFSGPNLRGLHKMLVVNAEANMIMMGIGINHAMIGNMYRGKHPGNPTGKKHKLPTKTKAPKAAEKSADETAFDKAMGL